MVIERIVARGNINRAICGEAAGQEANLSSWRYSRIGAKVWVSQDCSAKSVVVVMLYRYIGDRNSLHMGCNALCNKYWLSGPLVIEAHHPGSAFFVTSASLVPP
jgi:hypothetical protein